MMIDDVEETPGIDWAHVWRQYLYGKIPHSISPPGALGLRLGRDGHDVDRFAGLHELVEAGEARWMTGDELKAYWDGAPEDVRMEVADTGTVGIRMVEGESR